jgi:hypothetical protein
VTADTWDDAPVSVVHAPEATLADDVDATRALTLGATGPAEVGLWEIDPGTACDVEEDEIFVVLSGRATVSVEGWCGDDVGSGGAPAEGLRHLGRHRELTRTRNSGPAQLPWSVR